MFLSYSILAAIFGIVCCAPFAPNQRWMKEGFRTGSRHKRATSYDNRIHQLYNGRQPSDSNRPVIHLIPESDGPWGGIYRNCSLDFSWKTSPEIHPVNMSLVHENNFIQVPQTGVYFVYAQLYFRKTPKKFGHCITKGILDEKDIPRMNESMCSTQYSNRGYDSQTAYVGGPVMLQEKDIIGVRALKTGKANKMPKVIFLDKRLDFFGAYLM